ncbi:MAG TPA: transcription elongation factor GreA [Candidatus Moranbacteria bacterium]|nr:transcription elongation factor GreA [Candidatus Moranbacteria bacterium]
MSYTVTRDGLKKLKEELRERTGPIRQKIAAAIKEAKEQGDLSENAEYSEAKREQAENEARIAQLEDLIKNAQVLSRDRRRKGVQVGSRVKVRCRGRENEFVIVGSNEVDPAEGKISVDSPIGKALMGKEAGEKVSIETPGGKMECEIVELS